MKIDRIGNAKRNIIFGMLSMSISLLLPFFTRTVLIYTLGELYTGLSGLFQSVFQILNIFELGFGVALVYFLYEPIAKDEQEKICAILNYYKRCYKKIGTIVFVVGMCIMPFVPYLIKEQEVPNINIYFIYFLMLINTSVGYFMFPQARALLTAYQRSDYTHKIAIISEFLKNVFQITVLLVFKNYYLYILIIPVCELMNDFIHLFIVKKEYPNVHCKGELDVDFKRCLHKKISGLFTYKIGSIISNFADSVVISAFLGLGVVAVYSNYYYIITAVFSILAVYYSSISAGLGNSIVLETVENNYRKFQILQFAQEWLIGWISICLVCLFQPFIRLWVGEDWLLPFPLVLLLVLLFYVWKIQDIVTVYKEAAGLWDKDKFRPLISAIINLTLNLLTVNRWGLYGVVISTLISVLIVDMTWVARSIFKMYFKVRLSQYYIRMLKALLINIGIGIVTYYCCELLKNGSAMWDFVVSLGGCMLIPNTIYILFYRQKWEFRELITRAKLWRKKR